MTGPRSHGRGLARRTRTAVAPIAVLALAATALAGCASSGKSASAAGKVYTIKLIDANSTTTPQVQSDNTFKQLVEKSSGGRIKVTVYPNGVVASADKEVEDVGNGVAQMTNNSIVPLAQYTPAYNFLQLPMIFSSQDQMTKGFASSAAQTVDQQFQQKSGIKVLAWQSSGWVQFANSSHPITTPADMSGLKFRIIPGSAPLQSTLALLGAETVPLAENDAYTAEQNGTINGNENPPTVLAGNKEDEVLKYLTVLNYQNNPNAILINAKFFDSLPSDLQKDVEDAAAQAASQEIQALTQATTSSISTMEQAGVKVTTLTQAQRQAFIDAIKPYLTKALATYDPALVSAFGVSPGSL